MALVSASSVPRDKPISVETVVTLNSMDCSRPVAFVGPAIYGGGIDDGDPTGNYRALYLSCGSGSQIQLYLYSPRLALSISAAIFQVGVPYALRIDWVPGLSATAYLNGVAVYGDDGSGPDTLMLNHDPHPALWFGVTTGEIGRFDVYTAPSQSLRP
jgi:hypothetical protein